MPIDVANLRARQKVVEIDGIGQLTFREPTLADVQRSQTDLYWWVACVTCADGSPFLSNPQEAGQIRADLAARLLEEVNKPVRPTHGSSDASGESPTMGRG